MLIVAPQTLPVPSRVFDFGENKQRSRRGNSVDKIHFKPTNFQGGAPSILSAVLQFIFQQVQIRTSKSDHFKSPRYDNK